MALTPLLCLYHLPSKYLYCRNVFSLFAAGRCSSFLLHQPPSSDIPCVANLSAAWSAHAATQWPASANAAPARAASTDAASANAAPAGSFDTQENRSSIVCKHAPVPDAATAPRQKGYSSSPLSFAATCANAVWLDGEEMGTTSNAAMAAAQPYVPHADKHRTS